jgi:hypothetical protein
MKEFNKRFTKQKISATIDGETQGDRKEQADILNKMAITYMKTIKRHDTIMRKEGAYLTKAQQKVFNNYRENLKNLRINLIQAIKKGGMRRLEFTYD